MRSGKTIGSAVALAAHSLQYIGVDLLLLGVTHGAVLRNVVPALRLACRRLRIPFHGGAPPYGMGRNAVHVSGGSSVDREDKLAGMTIAGGIFDEAPRLRREVYDMAHSRASIPGARIWETANAAGPFHWYRGLYDRTPAESRMLSRIRDNPHLPPEYEAELRETLAGHRAQRLIDVEWAAAAGAIWPEWSAPKAGQKPAQGSVLDCGGDWGWSNPSAFVFPTFLEGAPSIMAGAVEYTGLGAAEVAGRVKKEWESRAQALGMPLGTAVVDPSAPDLIHQMSKLGLSVMAGRNDLDEGIATVDRALRSGDILLPEKEARPLLAAMSEYTWDEKAQERGEDKPVGRVAHLPDAMRYWCCHRRPLRGEVQRLAFSSMIG